MYYKTYMTNCMMHWKVICMTVLGIMSINRTIDKTLEEHTSGLKNVLYIYLFWSFCVTNQGMEQIDIPFKYDTGRKVRSPKSFYLILVEHRNTCTNLDSKPFLDCDDIFL